MAVPNGEGAQSHPSFLQEQEEPVGSGAAQASAAFIAPSQNESKQSVAEEHQHEIEVLIYRAERDCEEYLLIAKKATVVEDVSCDVWGALIFVVVSDLPDWRSGRMLFEGKVRMGYVFFVFIANLVMQGALLVFIAKLLLMPSLLSAQDVYEAFHRESFNDSVLDKDRFDLMSSNEKANLCGLALSQVMFVRVIIFLWVTNNVGELRDTGTKMLGAINLPYLPQGLDTRLMKRDLEASDVENNIICLNMKGKVGLCVLVFLPKFVISLFLMLTGCVWLMAAQNIGDLILNSLALAFVVKVDESLAQVFFPEHFLDMVKDLAFVLPRPAGDDDKDLAMQRRACEFFYCAVTLFMTIAAVEVMIVFQPVIPNYALDVKGACRDYMDGQVPWCMPFQSGCFPKSSSPS